MNESPLIHSSANMPPRRNRLSSPLVAALRRASAPMRTASAPAGDCTSAGLMMSGSSTDRMRSLERQPVTSMAAARAAVPMTRREFRRYVCTVISEAEVKAEREVARRRERLEGGRRVTGGAEGFGIHARVLGPEDAEVADARRDPERPAPEVAVGPLFGRVEAERQLAPTNEVTVLYETGDRLGGAIASGGGTRLIESRGPAIDVASAVVAAQAANALAVVVHLVIALVIHHGRQPEPAVPEVEAVRHRDLVLREGIAKVRRRVADGDFADGGVGVVGNDSVAVLVLIAEQGPRPPAIERIPFAILLRATQDDVRYAAEAHELVAVRRTVQRDVPAEGVALEQYGGDERFPARVPDLAEVLEAAGGAGA